MGRGGRVVLGGVGLRVRGGGGGGRLLDGREGKGGGTGGRGGRTRCGYR